MDRKLQFHKTYLKIADNISNLSFAVRKKVGAIIVDKHDNIISYGFNGTPSGFDNCCEYTTETGELKTKPEVLHAESNAITKVAKSTNSSYGTIMYITLSPCLNCAKMIIQAGIKEVYYSEYYNNEEGINFLKDNGIKVELINI